jgi:hypothetical protein
MDKTPLKRNCRRPKSDRDSSLESVAIVDAFEHAGEGNVANDRRLVAADDASVSFSWEDYRIEGPGR